VHVALTRLFSFSHGANDMPSAMGKIYAALASSSSANYDTATTSAGKLELPALVNGGLGVSGSGDQSIVEDEANNKLTLKPGRYQIGVRGSVEAPQGQAAATVQFSVRKDGAEIGLHCYTRVQDVVYADLNITDIIEITGTEDVDLEVYHLASASNVQLHFNDYSFWAIRLDA
jgi:phosphate/sulfate permease